MPLKSKSRRTECVRNVIFLKAPLTQIAHSNIQMKLLRKCVDIRRFLVESPELRLFQKQTPQSRTEIEPSHCNDVIDVTENVNESDKNAAKTRPVGEYYIKSC